MTKRRDIVQELKRNGFKSIGGTNHETFVKGNKITRVARHNEIDDVMYKVIMKQAGLR
jgi:mRNA interferase HicA